MDDFGDCSCYYVLDADGLDEHEVRLWKCPCGIRGWERGHGGIDGGFQFVGRGVVNDVADSDVNPFVMLDGDELHECVAANAGFWGVHFQDWTWLSLRRRLSGRRPRRWPRRGSRRARRSRR